MAYQDRRLSFNGSNASIPGTANTNQFPDEFDYKDIRLLRGFITPTGKIIPRRTLGTTSKQQRKISLAIKRARFLALIPYCDRHK